MTSKEAVKEIWPGAWCYYNVHEQCFAIARERPHYDIDNELGIGESHDEAWADANRRADDEQKGKA